MEDDDLVVRYHFENHETGEISYSSEFKNHGRN
jgi:hypothetical protein